jgi:hypothetical protein
MRKFNSIYAHKKSLGFTVRIFKKNYNCKAALHSDMLYRLSPTLDNKSGQYGREFIFAPV